MKFITIENVFTIIIHSEALYASVFVQASEFEWEIKGTTLQYFDLLYDRKNLYDTCSYENKVLLHCNWKVALVIGWRQRQ